MAVGDWDPRPCPSRRAGFETALLRKVQRTGVSFRIENFRGGSGGQENNLCHVWLLRGRVKKKPRVEICHDFRGDVAETCARNPPAPGIEIDFSCCHDADVRVVAKSFLEK